MKYPIYRKFLLLIASLLILSGCNNNTETGTLQDNLDNLESSNTANNHNIDADWVTMEEGLAYRSVQVVPQTSSAQNTQAAAKKVIIIRIDPKLFHFSIVQNESSTKAQSIEEINNNNQAKASFNGAFFSEEFTPLGLLISEGNIMNKSSKADLMNGIFVFDNKNRPQLLLSTSNISPQKYPFAIQNGPILLDSKKNIKIQEESGKKASRTAVGIDKKGNIIVILLQQNLFNLDNSLTLYEFAHILKEDPFFAEMGLHSVLNLDGGTSSGAIIGSDYFPEGVPVQNIIVVKNN